MIVDAGLVVPARRASRRRSRPAGLRRICEDREDEIRAVVLTHGHEDHVGALPYFLREIGVPEVWATKLTLGLVKSKLDEHGLCALDRADRGGSRGRIGADSDRSRRSSCAWRTRSPTRSRSCSTRPAAGSSSPATTRSTTRPWTASAPTSAGSPSSATRASTCMLGDSTNAERPGVTSSERTVGEAFRTIIPRLEGRVLIASFASNVHRVQQAIDVALETDRQVALDRPLAAQEREHRAEPRLPGRSGGDPGQARGSRRAAARARR